MRRAWPTLLAVTGVTLATVIPAAAPASAAALAPDTLLGTLKKTGGPVDVSGGWFDAGGGYEKFAYTASYAANSLLAFALGAAGLG